MTCCQNNKNIEGDGGVWTKGNDGSLNFTFKNTVDDTNTHTNFVGIKIDGIDAAKSNYAASKGSVIIKLNPTYLETLYVGNHTLTALFVDDLSASASFRIISPYTPVILKTGIEQSQSSFVELFEQVYDNNL